MNQKANKAHLKESKINKLLVCIISHPIKCVLITLTLMSLIATGLFSVQSKWSTKAWYDSDHKEMKKLSDFESQFGSDAFIAIGIHSPSGLINKKSLNMIKDISDKLWLVTDIIRVESLSNHNVIDAVNDDIVIEPLLGEEALRIDGILKKIENDQVIPHFFLNEKKTFSMIYGYLKPDFDKPVQYSKIEKEVESIVKDFRSSDVQIYLTGTVPTNNAFKEVARKDNLQILPFSLLLMMLLLYLFFKRLLTIILFIVLSGTTIVCTMAFLGHLGLYYNSFLTVVPGVMLAICTADIIHILSSYYHYVGEGNQSKEAMLLSLKKNLAPTILTTISTATSFASLMISDIAPIRDLGALSACGAIIAWIASYFLIAPLTLIFDKKRALIIKKPQQKRVSKYSKILTNLIYNYRYLIMIIFTGVTILSAMIASTNEVNSDPMSFFDDSVELKKSYEVTSSNIKGVRGIELVIDSGSEEGAKDPAFLRKVDSYISWLKEEKEIIKVQSIIDVIKKMNQTLHSNKIEAYTIPSDVRSVAENLLLYSIGLPANKNLNNLITLDNRKMRLRVTWTVEKSKEGNIVIQRLIKKARTFGIEFIPSGSAPLNLSMNDEIVDSFFSSMLMAILFVSLLLLVVYKNVLIGIISLLPNLIPLCIGGAVIKLMGYSIDIGTSIVCTVCLGIAIDDTIHFVSSFQKNSKLDLDIKEQIEKTFMTTGKALAITTTLLVIGFGSFVFADFVPNRNFGVLCSVILTMALLTDIIFLPALLMVAAEIKEVSQSSKVLLPAKSQSISSLSKTFNSLMSKVL